MHKAWKTLNKPTTTHWGKGKIVSPNRLFIAGVAIGFAMGVLTASFF
ncbi:hypothetical protein OE749_08045 [Aestuariibacter sp. AA17]|uniref:Uncharacterized protein n=1 Tax=Fluctibacter corallii TaxID=2984329 RepID=A0ABT3A7L0_9ALTE|nr:hypothetical protein [Aestuariibacter sp. AA17]MCV2884644.1 hypothetical protein [Aestuariibacter sp. AA17]